MSSSEFHRLDAQPTALAHEGHPFINSSCCPARGGRDLRRGNPRSGVERSRRTGCRSDRHSHYQRREATCESHHGRRRFLRHLESRAGRLYGDGLSREYAAGVADGRSGRRQRACSDACRLSCYRRGYSRSRRSGGAQSEHLHLPHRSERPAEPAHAFPRAEPNLYPGISRRGQLLRRRIWNATVELSAAASTAAAGGLARRGFRNPSE